MPDDVDLLGLCPVLLSLSGDTSALETTTELGVIDLFDGRTSPFDNLGESSELESLRELESIHSSWLTA